MRTSSPAQSAPIKYAILSAALLMGNSPAIAAALPKGTGTPPPAEAAPRRLQSLPSAQTAPTPSRPAATPATATTTRPAVSNPPANPAPPTGSPTATTTRPVLNRLITTPPPDVPGMGGSEAFLPSPEAESTLSLIIQLGERRVYLYENNQVKVSYPIAIGREGWETPVGKWKVMQMIRDPAWQNPLTGEIAPPGADNPLGTRWIGFWTDGNNFVGLHGTPNEASIGSAASHGCVRMYDRDAVALFELVRLGTPVSVVP